MSLLDLLWAVRMLGRMSLGVCQHQEDRSSPDTCGLVEQRDLHNPPPMMVGVWRLGDGTAAAE
jgi:hypothetical protein